MPGFASGFLLGVAEWRYDIDIGAADYLSRAEELKAPMLLVHGTADPTIPVEISDDLGAARPDLVHYERIEGVAHARAFQERPEVVEPAVQRFLEELLAAE